MNCFKALIVIVILFYSCSREAPEDLVDQRDSRVYRTVRIGDQIWMAENLAYMPYVSELAADSVWEGDMVGTNEYKFNALPAGMRYFTGFF